MGIEGIIEKIKRDTDAEIEKLSAEMRTQLDALLKEAEDYKIKAESEARVKAELESRRQFEQTIAKKEAELRKKLLTVKREWIEKTFAKARERILEMPPDELRKHYLSMLVSFGEKSGEIVFGKKDDKVFDDIFLMMASEKIPESNFTKKLGDFDHGFVLVSGKISYDARLSSIFEDLKEKMTDRIAIVLFGEDAGD